jgi:ribosomal protein S18 acetylase RimI-like enzyme
MIDPDIRRYREGDRKAIQDICYLTGYMGDSAAYFWRHKPSFVEVWTSLYLDREPESVYVAIKEDAVVGYLTGCLYTASAPNSEAIFQSIILKHGLLFRPGTAGFLWRAILDGMKDKQVATGELIDERWPSHLHINLLPDARGTGLGAALMESWLGHLKQSGSPGCHLGTLVENARAVSFFKKMGFKKHGEPALVPGMRNHSGERLHQQFMVWRTS